ncbi:hypothetical protein [Polaribacter glomeratus]|uniref:Fibronectin type-III domain-containing protein n=1 Tax=Polaribacter glomeratus TaxID=102 RepID=A0A2S7WFX8_9FLAO|nr:hypothetical protein [Polaribacter glomeratus]PQJ76538.1 hypothetical protein BTO16_11575 [Polaribacter glomeratus]TXD64159.1 hypothetical protein ESX12_15720 [Polaribacter glomeratus]
MKKKLIYFAVLLLFYNCEVFFEEDISNEQVLLLAPSNNSEVVAGSIQFNWQEVLEATDYQIQIATPDFEQASQIVLDSIVTNTIYTKDLEVGAYQWRIKASNSGYSTGYQTNSFSVN